MKNQRAIRKSAKVLCCILTAGMMMLGMVACGDSSAASQATTTVQQEANAAVEDSKAAADTSETVAGTDSLEEATPVFAQITAIDGNTITLALAEQPAMSEDRGNGQQPGGGQIPSGEQPSGEMPTGEQPSGEMPSGEAGQLPEGGAGRAGGEGGQKPEGAAPGGDFSAEDMPQIEITLTGETMTIEITADTIITVNGESASIDDLAVDDTVTVIMDGDIVNSISAGIGMPGNANSNSK